MGKRVDLKKVANAAVEDMTLFEHDLHYHDGHYRGGRCKYRDVLQSGDKSDAALAAANEEEGAIYGGRRYEGELIKTGLRDNFGIGMRAGHQVLFMEPDEKGWNRLMVWCKGDTPDDKLSREKMDKFFKDIGYEVKDYSILEEKGKGPMGKSKKVFTVDVYRPEKYEFRKGKRSDVATFVPSSVDDLTDETRTKALKRFGLKVDGGKVVKRTADDTIQDKRKRYLGIVGDWEGQSTKADKESGVWEKRRLESLKRAQEDMKREQEMEAAI